jgi:hypothetical protein
MLVARRSLRCGMRDREGARAFARASPFGTIPP